MGAFIMKKIILPLFLLPSVLVGCGNEDNRIPFEYTFENQTVTYDGEAHSIYLGGILPDGIEVTYSNNRQVNAGEYQVGATIIDTTGRYKDIPSEEIFATLTIEKAELDKEEFFPSQQITYDGKSHTLEVDTDKLPSGLTAEIAEPASYYDVGSYDYTVVVTDTNEHKNFILEESYTSTLTIGKITLKEEDFLFESVTVQFDGEVHSVKAKCKDGSSLPYFYKVEYANNDRVEEGEYIVTATFGTNESIFNNSLTLTTTLTITEQNMPTKVGDKFYFGRYPQKILSGSATIFNALQNMTDADKNENGYFVYDGKQYEKVIAKSPMSKPYIEGYGEFLVGTPMYFEVRPICWVVCAINNGQFELRSEKALDVIDYYNGGTRSGKYNSDYSISTLRAFLNGLDINNGDLSTDYSQKNTGFFPRAFNSNEAVKLVDMNVENTNGGGSYTAKNTVDKVKIISEAELKDVATAHKYLYYAYTTASSNSYFDPNSVIGTQFVIARVAHYRVEYGQPSLEVRTITRTPYGDNGHHYLEEPLRKFGNVLYYSTTKDTYDACIPIITVNL